MREEATLARDAAQQKAQLAVEEAGRAWGEVRILEHELRKTGREPTKADRVRTESRLLHHMLVREARRDGGDHGPKAAGGTVEQFSATLFRRH